MVCKDLTVEKEELVAAIRNLEMNCQKALQDKDDEHRTLVDSLLLKAQEKDLAHRSELESLKILLKEAQSEKDSLKQKLTKLEAAFKKKSELLQQKWKLLKQEV